ncbi:MAG: SMI1/KNR4 family protein [Lachnospiraceae bacterium]|nr:SMI1/KNR4 family protein [Lachnospiraceae bacterium]
MKRGKVYYLVSTIVLMLAAVFFFWYGRKEFGVFCAVAAALNLFWFILAVRNEKKEASHSQAYKDLKHIAGSGYERTYRGFYPELLNGIYDWERDETEDYIWHCFQDLGYYDMAPLLPALKKYDGVKALREKLSSKEQNGYDERTIAHALYAATGEEEYFWQWQSEEPVWKEELQRIMEEKKRYGESVKLGTKENDIRALIQKAKTEFDLYLPEEYIAFLRVVNGLEFNGFMIYGIDRELTDSDQNCNGLIDNNRVFHENEWLRKYLFLGQSDISWFVYDKEKKNYLELDAPSGREMTEYESAAAMIKKILAKALI